MREISSSSWMTCPWFMQRELFGKSLDLMMWVQVFCPEIERLSHFIPWSTFLPQPKLSLCLNELLLLHLRGK
jgi:hypothetical protein